MFSANRHVLSYQVTVWMACTVCSNTQGEARVQCHTFYETDTILIQLTSSTVAAVYHSSLCHSWFTLAARSAQCIINWFSYVKANAASITYSHVFCLMIRLNTNRIFGAALLRTFEQLSTTTVQFTQEIRLPTWTSQVTHIYVQEPTRTIWPGIKSSFSRSVINTSNICVSVNHSRNMRMLRDDTTLTNCSLCTVDNQHIDTSTYVSIVNWTITSTVQTADSSSYEHV